MDPPPLPLAPSPPPPPPPSLPRAPSKRHRPPSLPLLAPLPQPSHQQQPPVLTLLPLPPRDPAARLRRAPASLPAAPAAATAAAAAAAVAAAAAAQPPPPPPVLRSLVDVVHRVTHSAGLPPDPAARAPSPPHPDLTLHWLVDALERIDLQLRRCAGSRGGDEAAGGASGVAVRETEVGGGSGDSCRGGVGGDGDGVEGDGIEGVVMGMQRRRPRAGGGAGGAVGGAFVLRDEDEDAGTVDGLDGLEDCKVDSEDDVLEGDVLAVAQMGERRGSARRSRLIPRGRSAATFLNLPPLPDLGAGVEEGGVSARSSQAQIEGRPPFRLPIGSAGNSYLTHMSSWKSLGYGEANKLHADYNKIFRREDEVRLAPGESSIAIAAGEFYRVAPIAERWTLGPKIGEGGYSTVYVAMRSGGGGGEAVAAVKKICKKRMDLYNDKMVSREVFSFRLVEMAGGHNNIVELYEVSEDDENVYLVMELLAGGELFARIAERGQYTERDAANLVVSMLGSLAWCHRLNLMHRDVKPENFVFSEVHGDDADVKLTDFGIAHYSEDPSALCKTLCGTPLYVAPEVFLRQPYGPEADVWSLGVIVYIMLVGYPPFDDNDIVQLVKKIKYGPVKFDGPEWALISAEGKAFLANLLDKDASNRMTAQQALEHDWLKHNCQAATKNILDIAQTNIKSFVNRKRWRAAIQGVKAMNRIHKMVEMAREEGNGLDDVSAERIEVVSVVRPDRLDEHGRSVRASFSSSSSEEDLVNLRRPPGMEIITPISTSRPPQVPLKYATIDRKRSSSLVVQAVSSRPSSSSAADNGASMVLLPIDPAFESSGDLVNIPKKRGERPGAPRVTYSPLAARMESSPLVGTSSDIEHSKVLRTLSRNEGGVVRKMSSHARKLVGRGRRAIGVGGSSDRPPVMMEMGEQRKQRKFSWFK